jgi:starvation-inducible DNA-binding protein
MSTSVMTTTTRLQLGSTLQSLVVKLLSLTLDAKQAHWNVVGPAFLPLHTLTDELAADLRDWTDRLAERAVALGQPIDARPVTVAAAARGSFGTGWVKDRDMVDQLATRIGIVADWMAESLSDLELADPVAHDAAIETLEGLDKYRWMLLAHSGRGVG